MHINIESPVVRIIAGGPVAKSLQDLLSREGLVSSVAPNSLEGPASVLVWEETDVGEAESDATVKIDDVSPLAVIIVFDPLEVHVAAALESLRVLQDEDEPYLMFVYLTRRDMRFAEQLAPVADVVAVPCVGPTEICGADELMFSIADVAGVIVGAGFICVDPADIMVLCERSGIASFASAVVGGCDVDMERVEGLLVNLSEFVPMRDVVAQLSVMRTSESETALSDFESIGWPIMRFTTSNVLHVPTFVPLPGGLQQIRMSVLQFHLT